MAPSRRRRPSAPIVIALLALFVAAGGPAEARRLLTGADIRDHSLQTRDLSRKAVKRLRSTPRGSVHERALANGAVSSGKLANGAVTTPKLAVAAVGPDQLAPGAVGPRELRPGGVGGLQIADGSLDSRDVARFSGRFRISVPSVPVNSCWSGEPVGLAPEQAAADISGDLAIVTPDASWPERQLAFTVRNSANHSRFVLAGCNVTTQPTDPVEVGFRYAVLDLP
jgi:hypothetical protein